MTAEPLVCPNCSRAHASDERFCRECAMPLVHAGSLGVDQEVSERQEWARQIKPQYADGDLVRVVGARHQAEAELIQGLLLGEGIPSMIRRAPGFDVPDMLSAGGRDVLVPRSGLTAAREMLAVDSSRQRISAPRVDRRRRILAGLLAVMCLVPLVLFGVLLALR
jgi:hypothetical protein